MNKSILTYKLCLSEYETNKQKISNSDSIKLGEKNRSTVRLF